MKILKKILAMMKQKKEVHEMYIIYGRKGCIYCSKAKELLDNLKIPYEYHDVVKDINQRNKLLEKISEVKTVPQIFLNDKHIGGYTELAKSLIGY